MFFLVVYGTCPDCFALVCNLKYMIMKNKKLYIWNKRQKKKKSLKDIFKKSFKQIICLYSRLFI